MRPNVALCLLVPVLAWQANAQDSAIEVLREVDHAAFRESFHRIPAHDRYSRTERKADGSSASLVEVAVYRATVSDTTQPAADAVASGEMTALISSLLPEDPPYLADKYFEDFRYSVLPDTLLLGRLARVIHVAANPASGRKQQVQEVRYFIDDELGDLVALSIRQSTQTLFYSESSTCFVQLRRSPGLDWVPYLIRLATQLKLPLRPAVSLLRTEAFYGYAEA